MNGAAQGKMVDLRCRLTSVLVATKVRCTSMAETAAEAAPTFKKRANRGGMRRRGRRGHSSCPFTRCARHGRGRRVSFVFLRLMKVLNVDGTAPPPISMTSWHCEPSAKPSASRASTLTSSMPATRGSGSAHDWNRMHPRTSHTSD